MILSIPSLRSFWRGAVLFAFSALAFAGSPHSASNDLTKRPLNHEDGDAWKRIASPEISRNGKWVLYREAPGDGEATLVVVNSQDGRLYRHTLGYREPRPRRGGPPGAGGGRSVSAFTADAAYAVFLIDPSYEATQAYKKNKKKDKPKLKQSLGMLRLEDGHVEVIADVKSFELPEESGRWLAYLKDEEPKKAKKGKGGESPQAEGAKPEGQKKEEGEPAEAKEEADAGKKKEKKKDFGTSMVLRSLADSHERTVADVAECRFTKKSDWLLYIVSSKEAPDTDGVYAHAPDADETRPLRQGEGNYKRWALDKNETRLAFLSDVESYSQDTPLFDLYGWDVGDQQAKAWIERATVERSFEGMSLSDKERLSFSDDGKTLLVSLKEIEPAKDDDEEEDDSEKAKFDLWHWDDPYPQPQQARLARQYQDEAWECAFHIDEGRLVKLADAEVPDVELNDDGRVAFANTNIPYRKLISYDGTYSDVYVIDPESGTRTRVAEKVRRSADLSPGGTSVYWFGEDGDWYLYDIDGKRTRNITAGLDAQFAREDWDTPSDAAPYGIAGWTADDRSILVYDRFDIWEIPRDGGAARLVTEGEGRKNGLQFRYLRLDPEQDFVPADQPLLLSARDDNTMASGFYRDRLQGTDKPERLVMSDNEYSRPTKAEDADRLLFTRSSFAEYPDLWVADMDFDQPKRLSELGEQTEAFVWGQAELRDFRSSDGKPLKGILIRPEDFDPSRKYPLLVYIYETLHNNLHDFRHPGPGTSINPSYYVSNGYVLWMPDIEYGTGYPGRDALKCVLPGVQMLIREGFIDPDRVGIQGHSWGGYQIAYMVTQTNVFAAAEAGAPVSNMVSAYGGIRWSSGMVRQFQYERTQSRLGDTLWNVPLRYIENSPIFWLDRVQTPLMMIHNDEDGAVPWYQGIEMMMGLRRLGKEAYMFTYNGEDHGLRQRVNQKDYSRRMAEFFDHFLKGAPAPKWMTEGIRAWEKGKTDK